eukprot:365357-Chlamydomonas_euryale.AAC.7
MPCSVGCGRVLSAALRAKPGRVCCLRFNTWSKGMDCQVASSIAMVDGWPGRLDHCERGWMARSPQALRAGMDGQVASTFAMGDGWPGRLKHCERGWMARSPQASPHVCPEHVSVRVCSPHVSLPPCFQCHPARLLPAAPPGVDKAPLCQTVDKAPLPQAVPPTHAPSCLPGLPSVDSCTCAECGPRRQG